MSWFGWGDPVAQIRLEFPDAQSAIAFAERHGWSYQVEELPPRRIAWRTMQTGSDTN